MMKGDNSRLSEKGEIMRRIIVSGAAVLSLVCAVPAFATDVSQTPAEPAPTFEQLKADHLKKIDERLNSLQKEKTCIQSAKTHEELRACRLKHKKEMKGQRGDMRKGRPTGMGGPMAPPVQ